MTLLLNRQRAHHPDLAWLRQGFEKAHPLCLAVRGTEPPALPALDEVIAVLVSDKKIAAIHRDFMDIEGPTDVITFHHGEILISADTAAAQAAVRGIAIEHEIALYLIHGLLHLNGHEDATAAGFRRMKNAQEKILHHLITCFPLFRK